MKYLCHATDTSVTIKKVGKGALKFGVGGPVAAQTVVELCNEVNQLLDHIEKLERALEKIRAEIKEP